MDIPSERNNYDCAAWRQFKEVLSSCGRVVDDPEVTHQSPKRTGTYRDGLRHADAAALLGCSVRTIYYLLPAARRRLADTLDRLDLL